jgi:hypothetical protein
MMRWLLLLLFITLLLTLSCSQGSNPFSVVPNASLFFDKLGNTEFVVNGGSGTAYAILITQYKPIGDYNTSVDSLTSGARESFTTLPGRDSVAATWRNPNGTYGRVKGS